MRHAGTSWGIRGLGRFVLCQGDEVTTLTFKPVLPVLSWNVLQEVRMDKLCCVLWPSDPSCHALSASRGSDKVLTQSLDDRLHCK